MKREFKVGDRVRVYGARYNGTVEPFVATIEHIYQNGSIKVSSDNIMYCEIHPKQCRHLVKKERRRIWVKFHPQGQIYTVECSEPQEEGWIEFVEVRRKG